MKVSQRASTKASAHGGVYCVSAIRSDQAYAKSVTPVQSPQKVFQEDLPERKSQPDTNDPKDPQFIPHSPKVHEAPFIGPKQDTRVGTFNVQSNLSQERLALLTHALKLHKLSFLGLTETNKIGSGTEISYPFGTDPATATLYWSGHETDKKKHSGVALLVSRDTNKSLVDWSPVSDRILKARFVTRHIRLTVFVVYAPHSGHLKKVQSAFWSQLSDEIRATPVHDMLMVMGDMNANTGTSRDSISPVLGPWTNPAERNSPGDHMIDLCMTHQLCITNTFYKHKAIHRDSFRSKIVKEELKPAKLLDYILVNQRFRSSVLDTRVYRDLAEMVDSNHEAVYSKIRIKLRSVSHYRRTPRLDSNVLSKDERVRVKYRDTLYEKLLSQERANRTDDEKEGDDDDKPKSAEDLWEELKGCVQEAAAMTLPELVQRARIPWLTEEAIEAIIAKAKAFSEYRNALTEISQNKEEHLRKVQRLYEAYKEARNHSKIVCRKARENFWDGETEEMQEHMTKREWDIVYRRLRKFRRSKTQSPCSFLRDANGKKLFKNKDKNERFRNHFQVLYIDDTELEVDLETPPPGRPVLKIPDDEPAPTLEEVQAKIRKLKNSKAPGADQITSEMVKYGGPYFQKKLHTLIAKVWESEKAPQDWKDAVIVTLYKKNDASDCDNYRGLSLLSVPGKVYTMLLMEPLQRCMENAVAESQCGFRSGRSTTDQLFTLQQILLDSWEFDVPTHTCFIDLRKAYDTVNRPALWGVLQHIGLSAKVQRLIRDLHNGTRSSVRAYGITSEPFEVNRGVRQGCILAPALFNIFLDHVLRIALDRNPGGVKVRYTLDGEVYVKEYDEESEIEEVILSLLYADDMAIVCDDADSLNETVTKLDDVLQQWGLEMSAKKTEVLTVDRHESSSKPNIVIRNQPLKNVQEFKYLGTIFTSKPTSRPEQKEKPRQKTVPKKRRGKARAKAPKPTSFQQKNLDNRLAKANAAFYSLAAPLYRRKDVRLCYKLKVFKMTALPTLLYGSEIWALKQDEIQRLESWQNRCLRYMLRIRYKTHGYVSGSELRKKCRLRTIEACLRTNRLRWFGHAARMSPERIPRKMITGHLGSKRPPGRPRANWRQVITEDLKSVDGVEDYPLMVKDRDAWRRLSFEPHSPKPNRLPLRRSTRLGLRRKR